jgi:rhamnose transport system substrate-binding protein
VKSVVLWNPVDLGYAAMHVLRAGRRHAQAGCDVGEGRQAGRAPGHQRLRNPARVHLLGAPYRFTKDNINQFDF